MENLDIKYNVETEEDNYGNLHHYYGCDVTLNGQQFFINCYENGIDDKDEVSKFIDDQVKLGLIDESDKEETEDLLISEIENGAYFDSGDDYEPDEKEHTYHHI
jgi:hypothetical protein